MTSVLVTGCAGFIGSNLSEILLQRGYRVIGIDNFDSFYSRQTKEDNLKVCLAHPHFRFYQTDINALTDSDPVNEPVEAVIHIAAKAGIRSSINDPAAFMKNNINGTLSVLEWMRKRGINKMIFASSSSVYGNQASSPFLESANVDRPISPYAVTKKAGELLNYNYHHLYGFDILNLRFFTVYGERQRPDLAIYKFTKAIFQNQPVTMYGDGNSARDYTYIQDAIEGIISALQYIIAHRGVYEIINIGNNKPVSLHELIDTLGKLTEKQPDIIRSEMQPGDVEITCADITSAHKLLGYQPQTEITEGLKKFIAWYKANHFSLTNAK